jgi:hypothetical protein
VNERASRLAVYFNLTATAVQAAGAIFLVGPLALLTGSHHYLASFTPAQLHGFAAMALRLNYYAYTISLVFFAGYDLLIGVLAWRSPFLPRPNGALMIPTGLAWLTYALPNAAPRLAPVSLFVGSLGEISLILWLLVRGVSEEQWLKSPNRVSAPAITT